MGVAAADSPDSSKNSENSGAQRPGATRTAPERAAATRAGSRTPRTARVIAAPAAAASKPDKTGIPKAATPTRPAPSATKVNPPDEKPSAASDPANSSAPAAALSMPAAPVTVPPAATQLSSPGQPTVARAESRASKAPVMHRVGPAVRLAQFLDTLNARLSSLPANPVSEFIAGALLLTRRVLLPGIPTIPVLTVGNSLVPEGSAGDPQTAVFDVSLRYAYDDTVTVQYSTEDGTATGGADYTPVSGVLVFAPGQTTQQVSVSILPDGIDEPDEAFGLKVVSQPAGGRQRSAPLGAGSGVIGTLPTAAPAITIPELDSPASTLAVRVDPTQQFADAIKVDANTTFTLTLPGPVSSYTVMANKPALVDITGAGNQLTLKSLTPGFLGLSLKSGDGTSRYLGMYIADQTTHLIPDTVTGYLPVGSITSPGTAGDAFLQDFNFREGVAPIDYLYIYDQGGADSTDGNLRGLLTQSVRHGLIPVVVFYNIQAVNNASGSTKITEGPDAAYQAINDYNWSGSKQSDPNMFTGYMKRYYTKLAADFTAMNNIGVPVQVVMEPDFLGYMAANKPSFTPPTPFVPTPADRTLNTVKVSSMYDAGLLTRGTDKYFPDTVAGFVQSINYYVGEKMPNLRIGWKTNIWAVAATDFQNQKMGLLHETDSMVYPWQNQWTSGVGWTDGRKAIIKGATNLGNFLNKAGVTSWAGSDERKPFLAIDKYGVDGAFLYDTGTSTAARGVLSDFVASAQYYCTSKCDPEATQNYFGLDPAGLLSLKVGFDPNTGLPYDPRFPGVLAALQNAAVADPNIALWFVNADQWNNYLLLVKTLSTTLNGTKVMLWQIPQGHINGSTTLTGRDLPNNSADGCAPGAICGFEDSATSYFFGDTFTATGGRLAHFRANKAEDPGVTVSGSTINWGEHMTLAADSGALSVLFGAGLGVSTRGSVTPAGVITDGNFWKDKATGYLSGVVS